MVGRFTPEYTFSDLNQMREYQDITDLDFLYILKKLLVRENV